MMRKLPRSKDIQLVIFLYISWVWQIHNWLNICNLWTKFHTYKSILFSRHIEWICTKECRPMRTDKWWYTQLFTWPWCSSLKLRHATVYPFIQMNFTLVILQYIVLDVNDIGFASMRCTQWTQWIWTHNLPIIIRRLHLRYFGHSLINAKS